MPNELTTCCTSPRSFVLPCQDKNVDKFEIYMVRNVLKVPSHLDLSAEAMNSASATAVSQEEEVQMDADLQELRRKIHQAEFVHRAMSAKIQDLQQQLKQHEMVSAVFNEAELKLSEESLPSLESAVTDVLCKEPEIKALEKQYRALEVERVKENTPMETDEHSIETQFTRCKAKLGGVSTRNMEQLGTLLGAR